MLWKANSHYMSSLRTLAAWLVLFMPESWSLEENFWSCLAVIIFFFVPKSWWIKKRFFQNGEPQRLVSVFSTWKSLNYCPTVASGMQKWEYLLMRMKKITEPKNFVLSTRFFKNFSCLLKSMITWRCLRSFKSCNNGAKIKKIAQAFF